MPECLKFLKCFEWLNCLRHIDTRAHEYFGLSGFWTLGTLGILTFGPLRHIRHLGGLHLYAIHKRLYSICNVFTALIRNMFDNVLFEPDGCYQQYSHIRYVPKKKILHLDSFPYEINLLFFLARRSYSILLIRKIL